MSTHNTSTDDFQSDMTIRWSCRTGDFIFWFAWKSIFADVDQSITIRDIWEMKDGDFVTITNRIEDLPEWFALHPTEVCNTLVYQTIDAFNRGEYPDEPIEGPNIWRLKAGDRLVWATSPGKYSSRERSNLSILSFRTSALVIGENVRVKSCDDVITFGALTKPAEESEGIALAREALKRIKEMGVPREFALEWRLG